LLFGDLFVSRDLGNNDVECPYSERLMKGYGNGQWAMFSGFFVQVDMTASL